MMSFIIACIQTLLVELAGVAVLTGALYVYWNMMTKARQD